MANKRSKKRIATSTLAAPNQAAPSSTFGLGKKSGSTKTNTFDVPTHVFILLSTNLKVRKYMHQRLKRYGVTFTKLAHFSLQYRLSHRIIHDVLEIKLYLHVSGTKTTLSLLII